MIRTARRWDPAGAAIDRRECFAARPDPFPIGQRKFKRCDVILATLNQKNYYRPVTDIFEISVCSMETSTAPFSWRKS